MLKVINGCCICLAIFMIILQYLIRDKLYYINDVIGQAADGMQIIMPLMSYLVIICESNWKKVVQEDLNKSIYFIQRKLRQDQKKLIQILIKYFLMMNGVCAISEILIIIFSADNQKWRNNILFKTFLLIANRLSDFQITFYVLQLTHSLKQLNTNLSKSPQCELKKEFCKRLKSSAEIVNEIWKANYLLNLRFGLSLLFTVTTNFLIFISSSYWIAYKLLSGGYNTTEYAIASISFIISPIVNLIVLFYCCSCCTSQVLKILVREPRMLPITLAFSFRNLDLVCTVTRNIFYTLKNINL